MTRISKLPVCRLKPKIFCIGLNKTGTTSFGEALKKFGYGWVGMSPRYMNYYKAGDMNSLFKVAYNYDVLEDIPWPLAYKELDQHFPNAKFVLTTRETPEKWLKSITDHIISEYDGHEYIYGHFYPKGNESAYLNKYNKHNSEVIKYFKDKPGKLLSMCFEHGDGWDELLPFLGIKGRPRSEWPHVNKAGSQPSHLNMEK